jgi:hypothetical protein
LRADSRKPYLEVVEHFKGLVKFSIDVWYMSAEGVLISATVVTLKIDVLVIQTQGNSPRGRVASRTLTLLKASLSELSIARQLLRSSASFSWSYMIEGYS